MRLIYLTLAYAIFFSGCGKIENNVSDRDYAIELLNDRNYADSIVVLKRLVADNPEDDSNKILLATAYGGLAGMDVVNSFKMFVPTLYAGESLRKRYQKIAVNPVGTETKPTEVGKKIEKDLLSVIDHMTTSFAAFFGRPNIELAQRTSLVEALLTLSYIPESSPYYGKAKGYSVIVNLMQFISYTRDAFPTLNGEEIPSYTNMLCAFDPALFLKGIRDSSRYLANAAADLIVVAKLTGRKSANNLESLGNRITEISETYDGYQDSIVALDLVLKGVKTSLCE
jgi:hypothetical protein